MSQSYLSCSKNILNVSKYFKLMYQLKSMSMLRIFDVVNIPVSEPLWRLLSSQGKIPMFQKSPWKKFWMPVTSGQNWCLTKGSIIFKENYWGFCLDICRRETICSRYGHFWDFRLSGLGVYVKIMQNFIARWFWFILFDPFCLILSHSDWFWLVWHI